MTENTHFGFWSGNLFLIAPFPDLCLLVPFHIKKQSAGTFFGCEPVIAERGLSGASDFMGFTVEWWHSQATCTAMPGKLWFPRNRGTNMTENAHFRIEKECRGYPLRLGTFSTFGSWRPSGFCSPYKCLHGL